MLASNSLCSQGDFGHLIVLACKSQVLKLQVCMHGHIMVCAVLGIEPGASCMSDKLAELHQNMVAALFP